MKTADTTIIRHAEAWVADAPWDMEDVAVWCEARFPRSADFTKSRRLEGLKQIRRLPLSWVLALGASVLTWPAGADPFISAPGVNLSRVSDEEPRVAAKDDLVGAWERVPFPSGANTIEPWPLPYQYFAITADGRIGWMMTSEDQKDMNSRSLFEEISLTKWNNYQWYDGGYMLISYSDSPGMKDAWIVKFIQRDSIDHGIKFKAGDIMMTLLKSDGAGKARGVYYRLLRHLPS